jgi:hypothetical protein
MLCEKFIRYNSHILPILSLGLFLQNEIRITQNSARTNWLRLFNRRGSRDFCNLRILTFRYCFAFRISYFEFPAISGHIGFVSQILSPVFYVLYSFLKLASFVQDAIRITQNSARKIATELTEDTEMF